MHDTIVSKEQNSNGLMPPYQRNQKLMLTTDITYNTGPAVTHKPYLIVFADDSTLFFATRMRDVLQATPHAPEVKLAWAITHSALSARQVAEHLPEGPDIVLQNADFLDALLSGKFEAIIVSRVFPPLAALLKNEVFQNYTRHACVVSFLGGLDFSPEKGYFHRRNCNCVFVFPRSEITVFSWFIKQQGIAVQQVDFGHPSVIGPKHTPGDLSQRRDVYFFAQAISPITRRARMHILELCIALANAYPDRTIWIKLRHLPSENKTHIHQERFDYPGLLAKFPNVPDNLKITDCSMETAVEKMAIGLTCTSTAALDVIREGIPCMVYLDYVDNFNDPLCHHMRRLFDTSGLIASLDDVLNLQTTAPNPEWLDDMFCKPDLGTRVIKAVEAFRSQSTDA